MQPLQGVRVLDLTHAFAGPYCTYLLSRLGADVIKVEPPHGDDFRARPVFAQVNAGKRSVVLDLRAAEGQDAAHRLAATSDVVVENYRPGVAAALRVDDETLLGINDRLVYCSITGYGVSGPMSTLPAIEWTAQATTGLTSLYIDADADPMFNGLLLLDPFSGFLAHSAILAALLERARTGVGRRLDISMAEAAAVLAASALFDRIRSGAAGQPDAGAASDRRPTMARFATADGSVIFVAALHDKWFAGLCAELGCAELLADARFASIASRNAHADVLHELLQQSIGKRQGADLEQRLTARGIPAAVVRTMAEFADGPFFSHRSLLRRVDAPGSGGVTLLVPSFGDEAGAAVGPVPSLGQHTDEVLSSLS
jgi:crotonobetainyl-CoA:carnitine CoA-transferase CaiB-like acyl-CoA transferase